MRKRLRIDTDMAYDKTIKYVLRSGSFYVGNIDPKTLENQLVTDRAQAMVLDWRDNEQAKAKFFSATMGAPFVAEKLTQ